MGFAYIKVDVPEEPLHPKETLFDANVPFSENFRKADSTWTVATEGELKAGLNWWKKKIDNGEAEQFLKTQEEIRKLIGQTTCITSQKKK